MHMRGDILYMKKGIASTHNTTLQLSSWKMLLPLAALLTWSPSCPTRGLGMVTTGATSRTLPDNGVGHHMNQGWYI